MTMPNSGNETSVRERSKASGWRAVASFAAVICVGGLAMLGVRHLADSVVSGGDSNARVAAFAERPGAARPGAVVLEGAAMQVLADEWGDRIATDSFWRSGRNRTQSQGSSSVTNTRPSRLQGPQPTPGWFAVPAPITNGNQGQWQNAPRSSPRSSSGYRTVCVRLCDGAFFPVSFGTSEGNLGRDQATCSNTCSGGRLFYGKAGSDDTDDFVDLSGQRYSKLANANLFRTQYVESCKCKPHAWEQASIDQHRIYALEDQRRKGNRAVVAELDELKAKQLAEKRPRSRRETSRQRSRQQKAQQQAQEREAAAKAAELPVAALAVSTAPRSDVSRGQGGGGGERYASLGLATGSIGATGSLSDATPVASTTVVADPDSQTLAGTSAQAGFQAGATRAAGADAPEAAGETGLLEQNGPVPDAAAKPSSEQGQAVPAAAVKKKKKSSINSRAQERQSRAPQPGMMRLGAGDPQRAVAARVAARAQPRPRTQARPSDWASRVFAGN